MEYWDEILRFHESVSKGYSSGEEGLKAVRFLIHFFKKLGCTGFSRDHPLNNRLGFVVEQNYQWLIQYAKKLYTASSLSGFEEIATRLKDHRTFLNANNEIEVALKFHLAELDVSFVPTVDTRQTPDILLKIDKNEYTVEVSSLNPPDQEARAPGRGGLGLGDKFNPPPGDEGALFGAGYDYFAARASKDKTFLLNY